MSPKDPKDPQGVDAAVTIAALETKLHEKCSELKALRARCMDLELREYERLAADRALGVEACAAASVGSEQREADEPGARIRRVVHAQRKRAMGRG